MVAGASAFLFSAVVSAGSGATPAAVSGSAQLVPVPGKVHRLAQPRYDLGEAPSSLDMGTLQVVLATTPAQQADLKQLIAAQQDPRSPQYHHFLTPAQYGARFGASDGAIAAVTQWLDGNGFKVLPVAADRARVRFYGTKAQVEAAFHTEIHLFDVNGQRHFANVEVPQVPATVAPLISAIQGLHDFYPRSNLRRQKRLAPETTYDGGQTNYAGPGDFAVMYNVTPLYQKGINGAGVSIAIGAESDINPAIVNAYWQGFGITPAQLQSILVPGGTDPGLTHDGKEDEAYLDVELAGGIAPGAKILLVREKNVMKAAQYVIEQNLAGILNLSFGECEANLDNASLDSLFQQAASEGITVTVSSGDQGVAGCITDGFTQGQLATSGFAVNGNASSPHVLAVGGTEFDPTKSQDWATSNTSGTLVNAQAHIPEMVWNSTCADPQIAQVFNFSDTTTFCNTTTLNGSPNPYIQVATASGGLSSCTTQDKNGNCTGGYAQPEWQQGVNGIQSFGSRAVPDVSLLAHSWLACSYDNSNCDPANINDIDIFAGTSAAAPAMAAIIALVDQTQVTNASADGRQGLINPALYALAATEYGTTQSPNGNASQCSSSLGSTVGSACAFYDVTAGTNATACEVAKFQSTGSAPASSCIAPSGDTNGILAPSGSASTTTYAAATGFDLASGLGSVNATYLVLGLALPAPAGLAATAGGQSVKLSWAGESQATSFNVYQGTSSGQESTSPVVTGATGTSATIGGLSYGQTYYFTIAAVSSLGTSAWSNEARVTTLPAVPTGLTASAGNGTTSLSWTASSGAVTYNIYQGTSSGGEGATPAQTGLSTTSASVTGLANGTTYYFTVAAVDSGGTSAQSTEAHATPAAPAGSGSGSGSGSGGGGGALGWLEVGILGCAVALRALRRHGLLRVSLASAALVFSSPGWSASRPATLHDSGDPTLTLTPPLRGAGPAPPGSAPPNPDPRDFEGIWWLQGYEYLLGPEPGVPPPLKPQYMKLLERRIRAKNRGTPEADASTQCLPHGMPRLMESPYPIEIVQTPGRLTFLHEVAHNVRRIWLNRPHPPHPKATFLGDSVGHWEGDTLIVDTVGLNDRTFIDDEGSAHSTQLHVIERYRKIDGGANLELVMTVDDPVTLERPYSYRRIYHWRPDARPAEYVCEENNRNAPINGVTVAK